MTTRWCYVLVALAATFHLPAAAQANLIDYDPNTGGAQTASWPEPSTIMIFVPAALAGDDRMNFEMGINAIVQCLRQIMVQFKDGEPPQNAMDFIDVNIANLNPPPFGVTAAAPFFPLGQNHGMLDSATITIDPTALGGANFMKNLGTHEFGHGLGLDDDPRQAGARTNVMDPDFNRNDPFLPISARDKMMLMMHYQLVPEPTGLAQWAFPASASILLRRRSLSRRD